MKQNPNKLSLIPLIPLLLLFAPLIQSTPLIQPQSTTNTNTNTNTPRHLAHYNARSPSSSSSSSSADPPHSRLQGRPGWNPLWGIGPVVPPPGSLDNVPVNNDPGETLNTDSESESESDPPAEMGTDAASDADTDVDLAMESTDTSSSDTNANAANDGGDTQAENDDINNTSAN